ncbi:MAG: flagellar export protein FliJ [Deltaproteobacteria bacterium]|nr:flagellar export protein FliJ [Deltaproteobacteria bacterium]
MFNFRLQTILDVRKTMEDKVLSEFSEKQKELQKEKGVLQSIQQQKKELMDALRDIQGRTVNVSEITMNSDSMKRCQKKESLQKERLREAKMKVNAKREELLEAAKKRKVMETLKTRQLEKYRSDAGVLERKAVDEMAIARHNRRKQE